MKFSAKKSRAGDLDLDLAHLLHPVALHAVLCHIVPGDHASNLVICIYHHKVTETHGAEEAIAPLHAAALIDAVRCAVHVWTDVEPGVLRLQ